MNTPSSLVQESPHAAAAASPAPIPASRCLYWLVRRELWENRSVYLAAPAVAALLVFGHVIATIGRAMANPNLAERQTLLEQPSYFALAVIMAIMFLVSLFYCLDALHGERRDRSILFWKSLPVSDHMTVLSKALIPIVIIPLLTSAVAIVAQFLMLLLSSLALLASGLDVSALWAKAAFFEYSVALLYHLVAIHGFWYAPYYGWLLMVSAWAQRLPLLWATVPLLVIAAVEKISFGTAHVSALLLHRMGGGSEGAKFPMGGSVMHPLEHLAPGHFLVSPDLWIGLALAAVFLHAAARLRRERDPL